MAYIDDTLTIQMLLAQRAQMDRLAPFCQFDDHVLTAHELETAVRHLATGLIDLGIRPGDRVGVMLPNHPDHMVTMLALLAAGAIWIPINVHLFGPSLRYVIEHSAPRAIIAQASYRDVLEPAFVSHRPEWLIWHGSAADVHGQCETTIEQLSRAAGTAIRLPVSGPNDIVCISYTSGTTGPPKGVLITDRMLRTAATGARLGGNIGEGDVLLVWEPLYHIGGSQIVILALMLRIKLILVDRFSASRFWDQVRVNGVTHIHHLGGILQMLLKQAPSERDRDHGARISWGGGCSKEIWVEFEQRFGVEIRELYGMTEASSISIANTDKPRPGSIGKPLPYFDVRIVDINGVDCPPDSPGELIIRGRELGLIMPGYFRHPEATAQALRDGWLFTGDLARVDEDGFFYYCGRKTDSVRHGGENISAWEVERIINEHPDVHESALIGVESDMGEQDLKVFVRLTAGSDPDPEGLIQWCRERMPRFQIPRYVAYVDVFEKTPTLRIRKEGLSRSTTDCWNRDRLGSAG